MDLIQFSNLFAIFLRFCVSISYVEFVNTMKNYTFSESAPKTQLGAQLFSIRVVF